MADINNVNQPTHSTTIEDTERLTTLLDKDEFQWSKAFDIDQAFARKELRAPQSGTSDSTRKNKTNIMKSFLKDFGNVEKHFPEKKSAGMQQHGNIDTGPLVHGMVSTENSPNRLNHYSKEGIAHLKAKPKNWAHFLPPDRPSYDAKKFPNSSQKTSFANCDKSMPGTSSVQQNFDIKKILKSVKDVLKTEDDDGNDRDTEQCVLDRNQLAVAKDKSKSSDTLQSTKVKNKLLSPLACDVLCGRGNICHPGNCLFRDLINLHRFLLRYRQQSVRNKADNTDGKESKLLEKTNKSDVIVATKSIVNAIRSEHVYVEGGENCQSVGKFVRKDTNSGSWYDIGNRQAEDNIKQALRERVGTARVYYYGKSNDSVNATGNEDLELGEEEHVDHSFEVSDEFMTSISEEYNQDKKIQVFPLGSSGLNFTLKFEINSNEENELPTIGTNDVILLNAETENSTDGLNLMFRELICQKQDQYDRADSLNKARVALSIVENVRNSDATRIFSYDASFGKLTRKEQERKQVKGFDDKRHHKGRFLGIDRQSGKLYDVGDLHAAEWTIKQLWRNCHSFPPYSNCRNLKNDQQEANTLVSSVEKPDGLKTPAGVCEESTLAMQKKASHVTEYKVEKCEKKIITEIRNTDVLFGRGAQTNLHVGNIRFRDLVNQHRPDYFEAIKIKKPAVANLIVDAIRKSNPAGRFLKRDEETGFWYDVGDKQAAQKASQALREKSNQERSEARTKIVAEPQEENSHEVRSRSGQVSLPSELVRQDHSQNVHPKNTSLKKCPDGEISGSTKRTHQHSNESELVRQDHSQNEHLMNTSSKTRADGEVSGSTKRAHQNNNESESSRQDHSNNVHLPNTSPKKRANGEVSGPTKRTYENITATNTSLEETPKRPRRVEDAFVEDGTNAAIRSLLDMSSSRPISSVDPMLQADNRGINLNAAASFCPNAMPSRSIIHSLRLLANGALNNRSQQPNAQLAGIIHSIINRSDFQQVNASSNLSLPMALVEMERRQLVDKTLRSLELARLKLIQQNSFEMASRQLAEELQRRQIAEAFLDRRQEILQELGISNVNMIGCEEATIEEIPQDDCQEFDRSSSRPEPQGETVEVTEYDILCGRGGMTNYHRGNKRFRELVSRHRPDYASAPKAQKPKVARLVVKEIRQGNPPGRFLKKDEVSGKWYDIGDKKAAEKVSQALREKGK